MRTLVVTNDFPSMTIDFALEWTDFHRPGAPQLYPEDLRSEIDEVNSWVYSEVNNGVYRCGFAARQDSYDTAYNRLFAALDRLEARLAGQRYLVGDTITEADVRLFTTLVRFDPVYHGHFKCNRNKLTEMPNLWAYARDLFQTPGFGDTTDFDHIKRHYYEVHRDINPRNVMVTYAGGTKIVDFGIAATRATLQAGGDGQFAGKLAYMAPEQVLGHELDLRADIFALGVVLYEMCLSRRLFRGVPEEVAERIVEGTIPAPTFVNPEFPPALEAVIMKALEVDPAERYQNCDHFFRDLEKFTEQASIRCTPRMISAYMSEMFGEGAPAEVNYDDQYDDLVDEALDFDKFDSLEAKDDGAPDWAKSFDAPDASSARNKRSMTIGNLASMLGPEFEQQRQALIAEAAPETGPAPENGPQTGRRGPGRHRAASAASAASANYGESEGPKTRRPASTAIKQSGSGAPGSGKQGGLHGTPGAGKSIVAPLGRAPTAGRPAIRAGQSITTGSLSSLDTGINAGSFGHGVMAEQTKKGGAALTWLLVVLGLGGLGYIAYTVFTMK